MLSPAIEDYLKTIYKLQSDGRASTSTIAQSLDVAQPSVSGMIKRLEKLGLVEYESYRGVELTSTGRKVALEIIRHHRLLETYLKEVMGYSWRELHEEAETLEHHISEEFEDKLADLLGHPTRDPHGHPIPTRDGVLAPVSSESLHEAEPGRRVIVQHLCDRDPDLLHYLEDMGMLPGATVEVVEAAPFFGPIVIKVEGREHTIGREVASRIFVESHPG